MGSARASDSVRSVPKRDSACTAWRMLLLPAALGPNRTVRRGNSMRTSASDLKPLACNVFSMTPPTANAPDVAFREPLPHLYHLVPCPGCR